MTNTRLATLLALTMLVSVVAPAAAMGGGTGVQAQQVSGGGTVDVTVGQQLSTLVSATDGEVRSEVDETRFELRFEDADDDERAAAIAARAGELAQRAIAIREDYLAATRAHEAGEMSDSEYAQRIATLNARAEDLAESVRRLRGRAAGVSALELRAEGFTAADLRAIDERLDAVSGTGAAALLQRFTGRTDGEVRIETRGGLSIEVEGEDGELSREIERPRDNSTNITVSQADALETARAELGSPPEGNWTLRRASVHEDDGYYRFRFALTDANASGEAEVRVDGSSGVVFRLETEIEPPDDDDDEREEREDDELALLVSEGTPGPGATVTLLALAGGEPVSGATVTLNDERVGTTDANGTITVQLPEDEAELRVESGDAEGELEFEFGDDGDEELRRHFSATGSANDGTVTVEVTYDGEPVSGATVSVDGRQVGETGADGRVTFDAQLGDEDDLEVEVQKGAFVAELEFEVVDGSLELVETEFDTEEADEDEGDEADEVDETDEDADEDEADEDDEVGEDDEADEEDEIDDEETEEAPEEEETEDGDEETEADGDDEEDAELSMSVVDGEPARGATVTIGVTAGGAPVEDAVVYVNDERVGTTDASGELTVTFPDEERVEVVAEHGDRDVELEFRFEEDSSGSDES